jgi:hypothetical protein
MSLSNRLAFVGGVVVLGAAVTGQEPAVFRSAVTAVSVDVWVRAGSKPLHGLTKEDFVVYEDTQPQAIAHFTGSREPIKLLALTATPAPSRALVATAGKFHRFMHTNSTNRPPFYISYSGLRAAVDSMRTVPGRKGIVVIHGAPPWPDAEREPEFDELLHVVRGSGIPIYLQAWRHVRPGGERAAARFRLLADQSGGGMIPMVWAPSGQGSAGEIDQVVSFIDGLATTSYTLTYQSGAPADGKSRRITIRLSNQGIRQIKDPKVTIWQSRSDYTPSPDAP